MTHPVAEWVTEKILWLVEMVRKMAKNEIAVIHLAFAFFGIKQTRADKYEKCAMVSEWC